MDPANFFDPELLYGEAHEEFLELFNLTNEELKNEDTDNKYLCLIFRHVEKAIRSGITIPPFGEREWINTHRPLDFNMDLKNRIFVLDFFTLCCINCIHVLDYLKEVESKYETVQNFAVIGIHSPKFKNEKNLDRVKEAVRKYDIKHPILLDSELKAWKTFGVYCWPTVFIVGPGHTLLFTLVGEAQIEKLPFLCKHIVEYCSLSFSDYPVSELPVLTIDETCGASEEASYSLTFPGSISTDGKILAVSDTGHNRILIMSKDLKLQQTIGSGLRGNEDGEFSCAKFNSPNGSAWYNGKLYVADTGNHSIREIDFDYKIILTILERKDGNESFQSPWDVCMGPLLGSDMTQLHVLYVAVAGSHQIWAVDVDPESASCYGVFAGSGKEENRANTYRLKAGFAQPSGIAYSLLSPDHIYIADSESSTIKSINLKENGAVKIIVGGGVDPTDLFQFGDKDGKKQECKLQHPLGIAVITKNLLAITDTYNHKVKFIDTANNESSTLDQPLGLLEPSGLCFMESEYSNEICGNLLYICDTNNHRIVPIQIYDCFLPRQVLYDQGPQTDIESFDKESVLAATELLLAFDGTINCRFKWDLKENITINIEGSNIEFEHQGHGLFKVEFLTPGGAFEGRNGIDPTLRLTSSKLYLEENSIENPKSSVKIKCRVVCCESRNICRVFNKTFEFFITFSEHGSKVIELFLKAHCA